MKALWLFVLTAGVVTAAGDPAETDPAKADLDKLQGTWVGASAVIDGKALPAPKEGSGVKLTYEGHKWSVKLGDRTLVSGTSKLDPTKKPKEIDVTHESGPNKGKTLLGIYELDGDTYKYCVAPAGKPRPTEFASKEGSGHQLVVNKREKP